MQHIAIFHQSKDKNNFSVELLHKNGSTLFPELFKKRGMLFGLQQIQYFINEEQKHDVYTLTQHKIDGFGNVRKLTSFSSGQQKQLLLQHIKKNINQLDYLVLDNPFDCMDVASQEKFANEFKALASKIIIIQIFKIRSEVLSFIRQFYFFKNNKIVFKGSSKEFDVFFKQQIQPIAFNGKLPISTKEISIKNPLVNFTNVNIFYEEKRQIVNNINWEINQGEFWHLKGPNGSGKTSLLTMITGDNPKAYGENIVIFGIKKGSGETVWDLKKKIGYFSPNLIHNFNKLFTVQQMILSGYYDSIGLYQQPTGIQIKEVDKWLNLIGLKDKKNNYFVRLSPEMQRVVLIIRAMVKQPPLLILDEPTNELDDNSTLMIAALINKIHKESNTTILFVSHRDIDGLHPEKTFELTVTESGSVGIVK